MLTKKIAVLFSGSGSNLEAILTPPYAASLPNITKGVDVVLLQFLKERRFGRAINANGIEGEVRHIAFVT